MSDNSTAPTAQPAAKPQASPEQFFAVDIRVGRVTAVEAFPEARRPAWKLTVDFEAQPVGAAEGLPARLVDAQRAAVAGGDTQRGERPPHSRRYEGRAARESQSGVAGRGVAGRGGGGWTSRARPSAAAGPGGHGR